MAPRSLTLKTTGRPMDARALAHTRRCLASPTFEFVSRAVALDLLATIDATRAVKRAEVHTKK